jgi:hypothetical protein
LVEGTNHPPEQLDAATPGFLVWLGTDQLVHGLVIVGLLVAFAT